MRNPRDLIRAFRSARISRREFVERAAEGALGLTATLSVLSATAHPQSQPPASAHPSASRVHSSPRGRRNPFPGASPMPAWLERREECRLDAN
jgi:hypothetical protein